MSDDSEQLTVASIELEMAMDNNRSLRRLGWITEEEYQARLKEYLAKRESIDSLRPSRKKVECSDQFNLFKAITDRKEKT